MKEVLKEAKQFQLLEDEIYSALYEEFEEDLASWNASIDKEKLIISFSEPRVFFDSGQFELKPRFKEILNDFRDILVFLEVLKITLMKLELKVIRQLNG